MTTSQKAVSEASACGSTHASFFTGSSPMIFMAGRSAPREHQREEALPPAAARPARIVQTIAPRAHDEAAQRRSLRRRDHAVEREQPVPAEIVEEPAVVAAQRRPKRRAVAGD